ncbi:MAG: hypothetical protein K2K81_01540 [Muribaculaceae bacterium]|nr:hypothetical protein [Muribaculaceae bacterium]
MIQITKMAGLHPGQKGGTLQRKSESISLWIKRLALIVAVLLTSATIKAISPLSFTGSIPEDGGKVSSFNDIQILFDFTEIENQYGSIDGWGIACEGFDDDEPEWCNGAILFDGDIEDGIILSKTTDDITLNDEKFSISSNALHLSFPGIQIEPNKKYTLLINYIVYAQNPTITGNHGYNDLLDNPITLSFYGSANVEKQLSVITTSLSDDNSVKSIEEFYITFNDDIEILSSPTAKIIEDSNTLASTTNFSIIDDKTLKILFDQTILYSSHNYSIVLEENSIGSKDGSLFNPMLSFKFSGASFHEFGSKRITPRPSQPSLIEEIQVTYDFPEGCGFINMEDAGITGYPMKVYKGEEALEENYLTTINGETTDGGALLFKPKYDFDAESKYTFVIEEGVVKPWIIGGTRGKTLPDYKCNPVTVTYTTPAIADIPKVVIEPQGANIPSLGSLEDGLNIPVKQYTFDETDYAFTSSDEIFYDDVFPGYHPLYEIGNHEDSLIGYYFFHARNTSDNGCYIELSTVGQENLPVLLEGKEYEFRFPEGAFVAEQNLLKKYSGSDAFNYRFKGMTSPINDFGLTANVDDRLHSHADVFSFVTESEVKAGENAKMILKDGEENVAEAPVYISREANGHRVYADFGGKKLESGKSYDVVLPEGSVYATNGIVNNPEIKSAITAMPETPAAPEFISIALNIDEYASATYRMVKGQESVLNLKAGDDWKLESLSLDGEDVTADVDENGLYNLPALDKDAKLDALYAYAHNVDYDFTTGVGEIEECPYTISKDAEHLVISGLKGGEQIAVYTMGGMKVADLPTVPEDMNTASIALPEGQVYIVLINGISIKYKH